jgi:hypothetical protein
MNRSDLERVARAMVAKGQGILAGSPQIVRNNSRTSPEGVAAATIRCGAESSGKHHSAQEAQVA